MFLPEPYTPELRALGKELRRQRQAAEMSLDKLTALTGADKGTLSRVETGQTRPKEKLIFDWVEAVDGNLDQVCLVAGFLPPDICKRVKDCPDLLTEIRELIF